MTPYVDRLRADLDEMAAHYEDLLNRSAIEEVNWGPGVIFPPRRWGTSPADQTAARMDMLRRLSDLETRLRLLFPHPAPEVTRTLEDSFGLLRPWTERSEMDWSIPKTLAEAQAQAAGSVAQLRALVDLLPTDAWPIRLVVDSNVLLDEPNLAVHRTKLGPRYMVHLMPIVFRELDDLKRNGRNPDIREAAKKADKRLKGLRTNGDVRTGARVEGDVYVIFEHAEPRADTLPQWLDLDVPDDRFVASALLLQSGHPGAAAVVATGDLNLQNKLAAVGLPFIEL